MKNMTPEKALSILKSSKQHFYDSGFSEDDTTIALVLLADMLHMFGQPYIAQIVPGVNMLNEWPIGDKKFPEVLRVFAGILEVTIDEKENKK